MATSSSRERPESPRNYEEISKIGHGAYGTVFKAIDIENQRTVALKRVRISSSSGEKGVPISTLREITLLKQLDNLAHPNVVRMFDAFQEFSSDTPGDTILTIVFEHVDQDLSQFIHEVPPPGLTEPLIKDIMHQLFSGIDHLHINRLIHRDIKPQNILITKDKQVKIADFGLARVYESNKLVTSVVVTLWYRAPEVLLSQSYTTMVDIWSAGAIMGELYNRRPIFPGKNDIDELHKIFSVIGCPSNDKWPSKTSVTWKTFRHHKEAKLQDTVKGISSEGIDLLEKILIFNQDERYNASACLNHSYFNDIGRTSDSQDSGFGETDTLTEKNIEEINTSPSNATDNNKSDIESGTETNINTKKGAKRTYSKMISNEMETEKCETYIDLSSQETFKEDDELSEADSGVSDISNFTEGCKSKFMKRDSVSPFECTTSDSIIDDQPRYSGYHRNLVSPNSKKKHR